MQSCAPDAALAAVLASGAMVAIARLAVNAISL
jgi:hypothetical protein